MKEIVIPDPDKLRTINLYGLDMVRWEKVKERDQHKVLPLREDPRNGEFILLDGHHTAAYLAKKREPADGIVYETEDEPEDPILRLNFTRALQFNDTTTIKGMGTIEEMRRKFAIENGLS
jgi:hypothetical protein